MGLAVGDLDGLLVGLLVGALVGLADGLFVGGTVGLFDGLPLGARVGLEVGGSEGVIVVTGALVVACSSRRWRYPLLKCVVPTRSDVHISVGCWVGVWEAIRSA